MNKTRVINCLLWIALGVQTTATVLHLIAEPRRIAHAQRLGWNCGTYADIMAEVYNQEGHWDSYAYWKRQFDSAGCAAIEPK